MVAGHAEPVELSWTSPEPTSLIVIRQNLVKAASGGEEVLLRLLTKEVEAPLKDYFRNLRLQKINEH